MINRRSQLSPAQLPDPDIPWHRISLGRWGGGSHRPPLLPYFCPLLLAQGIMGCTVAASGLYWSSAHRSLSQPFAFTWAGLLQGECVQKLRRVLGLKNQPCCNLTFSLWQLQRSGRQTSDKKTPWKGVCASCLHQMLPSAFCLSLLQVRCALSGGPRALAKAAKPITGWEHCRNKNLRTV